MVSTDEDGDTLGNAERKAVAEADEWLKHNQPIPHEDVLAEFGLTMADWEKLGKGPLPLENSALEPARRA
jgi:hypothetical protein